MARRAILEELNFNIILLSNWEWNIVWENCMRPQGNPIMGTKQSTPTCIHLVGHVGVFLPLHLHDAHLPTNCSLCTPTLPPLSSVQCAHWLNPPQCASVHTHFALPHRCTLYTTLYTVHTMYYKVYTVSECAPCTLRTLTLCASNHPHVTGNALVVDTRHEQCTVYSVQFTVYSVQCTLYSVQCGYYKRVNWRQ